MAKFPDRKATIKVLHTVQCVYPTFTCPSWWPSSRTGRPTSRYCTLILPAPAHPDGHVPGQEGHYQGTAHFTMWVSDIQPVHPDGQVPGQEGHHQGTAHFTMRVSYCTCPSRWPSSRTGRPSSKYCTLILPAPAHPDGQVPGQEGHHQGTAHFTMHVSDLHLPFLMVKFADKKATIKVLYTLQCLYPTCICQSGWPNSRTGRQPSRYCTLILPAPANPDGQVPGQEGHHQGIIHISRRVSDLHLPILMAKFPDRKATIKVPHTLQIRVSGLHLPILKAKFLDRKACLSSWPRSRPRSWPDRKFTIKE